MVIGSTAAADAGARARWFDGRSARGRDVQVRWTGSALEVTDGAEVMSYPAAALRVGEAWQGAPLPVHLPDGGTLWLDAAAPPAAALQRRVAPRRPAARMVASWPAVLAALAGVVAFLVWFDRQGAALAADAVLSVVPRAVDLAVGERAFEAIDQRWLQPSALPPARRAAMAQRFHEIAARVAPGQPVHLEFRRTRDGAGVNAFALPHGVIVVLDGLADELTDDELMAALGHELGHLVHRHALRGVAHSFGITAVAAMMLADFSTVAAGGLATLRGLQNSRDAEREADAFARRFVAAGSLPPQALASMWRRFDAIHRRGGASELPDWLSTHPSSEERVRAAQVP
jgi:Zn-dependent protease with chaperone function